MKSKTPSSSDVGKKIQKLIKPHKDDRTDAARLDELRRLLAHLVQTGDLQLVDPRANTGALGKWRQFLRQAHNIMIDQLCESIRQQKRTALRTLWGVVAAVPRKHVLNAQVLQEWIRAMQDVDIDQSIQQILEEFMQYSDVQYYTLVAMTSVANEYYNQECANPDGLLELLMMIPVASTQQELDERSLLYKPPKDAFPQPDEEEEEDDSVEDSDSDEEESENDDGDEEENVSGDSKPPKRQSKKKKKQPKSFVYAQIRRHHWAWSKAWLAVLRLPLSNRGLSRALQFVPNVLPHVGQPLRFSDFFIRAYQQEGVIPILALDGLFILMVEHGLEYPDYYKQLYKLVTPNVFFLKSRNRFIRLLVKSLCRNELLPAHLVAAFVKRLARCALRASPHAALVCLALISNLLRQHQETACLIHNDASEIEDLYDGDTDDPTKAGALQSSLWELLVLGRHYYPAVATLAKSIGKEDTKQALYDIEHDFLPLTYRSLFDQERKRKRKIAVTFTEPKGLFSEHDVFAGFLRTSD